jgi:hypothetical protein
MADAFQPRFVDLVRNYTSTTGTANFILGAAVAGYRGFGTELQPGESFYYSALGVDKPDEFEIGRGTMQADGTVSRNPIGGTLTDFTTGTKTVALVAAAEWYAEIESRSAAMVQSADTRDALAALSDTSRPALLIESGREGIFAYDPSDRSAEVAVDTAQGKYVAPAFDTTGASGAWVRSHSGAADPRWFGAALDGIADDKSALTAAIAVARHVRIPSGHILRTTGEIELPDGTFIEGSGGVIDFDASDYADLFKLRDDVSAIRIQGVNFTCSSDVEFTHLVRMTQVTGTTLDGLNFLDNKISYSPPALTGGDRWVIAGTGGGTRKNVRIRGNSVSGPMQLLATPVAAGTFQDSEVCFNRIHNARSNAISLLSSGTPGSACTLRNVTVTDNVITADDHTSLGIAVGLDTTGSNDRNVNIQNVTIARNRIDISGSSTKTADIYIRLGNQCAGIGGFDSVADKIVIDGNELNCGFAITATPTTLATQGQATNFLFTNNRAFGGDMVPRYLGDGAKFTGNSFSRDAHIRMGEGNGVIYSQANIYGTFGNITNDAEFTWRSIGDSYLGSLSNTDRVVTLNANAGKSQKAFFDRCTIDSSTTAPYGIRSAIYTAGPGNPAVEVRDLTSSTVWGSGRYEVGTGSIADYTGGRWYSATYDPPTLNPGDVDAAQTMSAPGVRVGDSVRIVFSQALQGLRLEAWVSASDVISYRFSNPTSGAVNLLTGTVRASFVTPVS